MRLNARSSALIFALTVAFPSSGVGGQDKSRPTAEQPVKPQPIPFSHKLHTQFIRECSGCHALAASPTTYPEVSYPPEAKCMQCHETIGKDRPGIKKLADYYKHQRPIPWVQVYELPDFVYFSHKVHYTKAGLGCGVCHGPVAERDVIIREKPINMVVCMACHRERGAPVKCNTCHNPNP
jgi:hypothetical protein